MLLHGNHILFRQIQLLNLLMTSSTSLHSVLTMRCRLVYRWDGLNLMTHQTLVMGTEMVPEISVIFNQLTRLIAQEDFTLATVKASDLKSYFSLLFLNHRII
jgi:hypothetical protein